MAKPGRVQELEQQYGDLDKIIPPMVNDMGQAETARKLGTSQFTISNWLRQNGYTSRIVYERSQEKAS